MKTSNDSFLLKYKEITGETVCNADGYVELHEILGCKSIYSFLDIDESDLDRSLLQECSVDKDVFYNEFSGLDFNKFKHSQFIFESDDAYQDYINFLKFEEIANVIFDTVLNHDYKVAELRNMLRCDSSVAILLLNAAYKKDSEISFSDNVVRGTEIISTAYSTDANGLPDDERILSNILIALNSRTVCEDISNEDLFSYSAYARETRKKYVPVIIDSLLPHFHAINKANGELMSNLLKGYEGFLRLEVGNLLYDFGTLPSPELLPSADKFMKTRYSNEVKPVFDACKNCFYTKCEERNNLIIRLNIRGDLQHTHNVSNTVSKIIQSFMVDQRATENILSQGKPDDVIFAARLYVVITMMKKINKYLISITPTFTALYIKMNKISQEMRLLNTSMLRIKKEYEDAYRGEIELAGLKSSPFSRKKRETKKRKLELQTTLLNNLKRYRNPTVT